MLDNVRGLGNLGRQKYLGVFNLYILRISILKSPKTSSDKGHKTWIWAICPADWDKKKNG